MKYKLNIQKFASPVSLPTGYTQLEYIESTGTQYLDTGIKYNSNTDNFSIKFEPTNAVNGVFIGGGLYSTTGGEIYIGSPNTADSNIIVETVSSNGKQTTLGTNSGFMGGEHTLTKQETNFYIDGTLKGSVQKTINAQYNLYLFALNRQNSASSNGKYKIYSFNYIRNGAVIANLIPAKNSSNVVGMYDKTNNIFLQNMGTGTFTGGPEVAQPNKANIKFKRGQLDALLANDGSQPAIQEGTIYFADNTSNTPGSGRIYFDTKDENNNDIRIVVGAGDALMTAGATQATDSQTLYLIGSQSANANHVKTLASKISVQGTTINANVSGVATSAAKLTTDAGSSVKPVYFTSGVPAVCVSPLDVDIDGNADTADKVNHILKFGEKNYDGSSAQEITAADLNIINALTFMGVTDTDIRTTSGGVTNKTRTIHIPAKDNSAVYTNGMVPAQPGSLVMYKWTDSTGKHSKQFYWSCDNISQPDNGEWICISEDDDEESTLYKFIQTAISAGEAQDNNTTAIKFVEQVTQDEQGVITPKVSTVRDASASQSGVVSTGTQTFAGAKTFSGKVSANGGLDVKSNGNAILHTTGVSSGVDYINVYVDGNGMTTRPLVLQNGYGNIGIGNVVEPSEKVEVNGNVKATKFIGPVEGKADTAGTADKVAHTFTVTSDGGSTENTDKYTFDGSTNKTLNLKSTSTVTLTETAGQIEFSSPSLSGGTDVANDAKVIGGVTVSGHAVTAKQKTITAGTGMSVSGGTSAITIGHSNSITAGTIGSSTASSGATIAIPYATYDAQGHITGKGTHNHTISAADLGLSNALHFIGTTTTNLSDGSTVSNIDINGTSTAVSAGDVVLDDDTHKEFLWTGSKWELLGGDDSYKVVQSAVPSPNASGNATAFIDTISQNANGNITVTKKNLDTSGTWSGNATTATTATNLSAAGTWTWGSGTSNGPGATLSIGGKTTTVGSIPSASGSASGIVTTGAQTFAGRKTFSGGVTLGADLQLNGANKIHWNDGTYQQRIAITDDSTVGTDVFSFQQTEDSGSSYKNLLTIKDTGIASLAGLNMVFTDGTATAAVTTSPYKPNLWTFNKRIVPNDGTIVAIKMPNGGHDYGTFLSLDNGTTYAPIALLGTGRLTTHYSSGTYLILAYEASGVANSVYPVAGSASRTSVTGIWRVLNYYDSNSDTYPSAQCNTAAGTAAKASTCTYWTATANSFIHVNIRYANTSASAITMNINSTGAKPIYINGTASSADNYTLPAGSYIAFYDGTNFYFRTDGKLTASITGSSTSCTGNAASASKVNNNLVLKVNTGTSEGTGLYTYNGSAGKTVDFKSGTNVTVTPTAGTITFSSPSLSGSLSSAADAKVMSGFSVSGHGITGAQKTLTAGTGMSISGTTSAITIGHSNSVTAATVGTSSATSGTSIAIPYVKYDAQGHITATGTHTHSISASDLGLSNAMHFIGVATVAITDGSTTDPAISGYSTKKTGDVIIDKDSAYEFVWTSAGKWERLGPDGSYKTVQSAVSDPSASGTSGTFIKTISQDANGVITATKASNNYTGTTDTSSKIFLVGGTSQAASVQTYTDNQVYATNGQLDANKVRVAEAVTLQYDSTNKCLNFVFA